MEPLPKGKSSISELCGPNFCSFSITWFHNEQGIAHYNLPYTGMKLQISLKFSARYLVNAGQ